MCCCGKPTVNGEPGYRWNNPDAPPSTYPVNPPDLQEGDTLLYDEPGRCGGLDSHSHHFRVVRHYSSLFLYVRHGGGDERTRLGGVTEHFTNLLAALDSTARYWTLAAMWYTMSHAARDAQHSEHSKWVHAIAQKRIKTQKRRGVTRVWIENPPTLLTTTEKD